MKRFPEFLIDEGEDTKKRARHELDSRFPFLDVASSLSEKESRITKLKILGTLLIQRSDLTNEEASHYLSYLHELFLVQTERVFRVKKKMIIKLMRKMYLIRPDISSILNFSIVQFESELSDDLMADILDVLACVLHCGFKEWKSEETEPLMNLMEKTIHHKNRMIRSSCLRVISVMINDLNFLQSACGVRLMSAVLDMTNDQDSRTRADAFAHMRTFFEDIPFIHGWRSPYTICLDGLCDRDASVRLECVLLISDMAKNAEYPIAPDMERQTAVCNSFMKLCDMLNDPIVEVREVASRELGNFKFVKSELLCQTFSKDFLSNRRSHRRDDASIKDFSETEIEDQVSLVEASACGAFVHGLEDEYFQVRCTTLDSIRKLAKEDAEFCLRSIDFLIDTFNDEIDTVRLNAMDSLRSLCMLRQISLTEEQMDIVTSVLFDSNDSVRHAVKRLLLYVRLASMGSLKKLVDSLLESILKFPSEKSSIYDCMRHLSLNHAMTLEPVVLGYVDYLKERSSDFRDPVKQESYTGLTIFIMNAASANKLLLSILPSNFLRHYVVIHDVFRSFFPSEEHDLRLIITKDFHYRKFEFPGLRAKTICDQTWLARLKETWANDLKVLGKNLDSSELAVSHIGRYSRAVGEAIYWKKSGAVGATSASIFLHAVYLYKLLLEVISRPPSKIDDDRILHARKILKHSYHLEYLTIDPWEPNRTIASKCSEFAHVLVSEHILTSTVSATPLSSQMSAMTSHDRLVTLAQEIGSIQPQLNVPDIMKVKIIEVHPSSNHLIEFDSRFPFDIDVVATLDPSWGTALQDIGFQVVFPDGRKSDYPIRSVLQKDEEIIKCRARLRLSGTVSKEPISVRIRPIRKIRKNVPTDRLIWMRDEPEQKNFRLYVKLGKNTVVRIHAK